VVEEHHRRMPRSVLCKTAHAVAVDKGEDAGVFPLEIDCVELLRGRVYGARQSRKGRLGSTLPRPPS
jgi:hypothetical protein